MSNMSLILEGLADERQAIAEKKAEYLKYIEQHKSNVIYAYNFYFVPLLKNTGNTELEEAIIKAGKNVQYHDLSKYETIEFEAYRMHWNPTKFEKDNKDFKKKEDLMYDAAWEHHHQNNKHHPEYWGLDKNPPEDMPLEYIIEMICDWVAMGMYYKTSTLEWWNSKKTQNDEAKCMTPKTIEWVNILLNLIKIK